ncbi:MAG: CPBP family intramembrane metalloprotease [Myxococcales bacterium]|nr:CPBP family intramembrane metalloprotease [Myxococcales bacterium]
MTEPGRPRRVWTVFASFALAVVAIFAGNVALLAVATVARGKSVDAGTEAFVTSLTGISLSATVTVLALSVVAVAAAVASRERVAARLRLGPGSLPVPAIATASMASLGASVAYSMGCDLAGLRDTGVLAEVTRAVLTAPTLSFGLALLALALGPALGEELFFRGHAQPRLEARWGRWIAVGTTSLLFAILHLDPKQGAFAFVAGLWLGYVASRAGSTRPGMVVHGVNNLGSLLLARFGLAPESTAGKAGMFGAALVVAAVGVALTVAQARRAHSSKVA